MPPKKTSLTDTLVFKSKTTVDRVRKLRSDHGPVMRRKELKEASRRLFGRGWATSDIVKNKAFQAEPGKSTGFYVLSVLDAGPIAANASQSPSVLAIKKREMALFQSKPTSQRSPFEVDPPSKKERSLRNGRTGARKIDWAALNAEQNAYGFAGEEWICSLLQQELTEQGRADLAAKVEHVSRTRGDGLGYDILSFDHSGAECHIEVKTTKSPKADFPFYLSRTELEQSKLNPNSWLYRVFAWQESKGKYWRIQGGLDHSFELTAVSFLVQP